MCCKPGCLLCCFNLCVFLGCRDQIISRNAFYPPGCSYSFVPTGVGQLGISEYEFLYKISAKPFTQPLPLLKNLKIKGYQISSSLNQKQNLKIPVIHISYLDGKKHRRKVIIHSHANCTDLGFMMDSYIDLAHNLQVDVIAYDYSGYGLAQQFQKHNPTDIEVIQNSFSIYGFATEKLKYAWNEIILYGQSLGSGPSTLIASLKEKPVGGLILHAGFSSGIRTILRNQKEEEAQKQQFIHGKNQNKQQEYQQSSDTFNGKQYISEKEEHYLNKSDFFPNYILIRYVNCPILIIHGDADNIVPLSHMFQLMSNVKSSTILMKLIIEGAGHNNIETSNSFRPQLFKNLRLFFDKLQAKQNEMPLQQLLLSQRASFWDSFPHFYFQTISKMVSSAPQEIPPEKPISINLVQTSNNNSKDALNKSISIGGGSYFATTPNGIPSRLDSQSKSIIGSKHNSRGSHIIQSNVSHNFLELATDAQKGSNPQLDQSIVEDINVSQVNKDERKENQDFIGNIGNIEVLAKEDSSQIL